MIEATGLAKCYGAITAVQDLSFTVPPGQVTGFLGPNGAGKSTTMRLVLGLDAPSAGRVTVNGHEYRNLRRPLFEIGALLETKAAHGGRSARNHLRCLALSNGIGSRRVEEVLDMVGLLGVADRRCGGFSLGMSQRLGIAAALLGDPSVVMLDEPVNGLDPEGVLWIRTLVKALAAEGRTVFLSSHLMSEIAITADRLIIIGRGRLIAQTTLDDLLNDGAGNYVRVRSSHNDGVQRLLQARGATVTTEADGSMRVAGVDLATVGKLAQAHSIVLLELSAQQVSLEQRYMELTGSSADYRAEPAS